MTVKTENKANEKRIVISDERLKSLAKDAFYGTNERLDLAIKTHLSYEESGRVHPANGYGLSDAIEAVKQMNQGDVLKCVEGENVRLMHDDGAGGETELLNGDECSISMIHGNITGINFEGEPKTEHTDYLAWVKKNLPFPQLQPDKVFIAVK